MTGVWRLRAALLVLGAALAVHQGRFLLAPRAHDHELGAVHAYLGWFMPAVAALIFLVAVQFVVWLRRAEGDVSPGVPASRVLWSASTAAILTVFAVQESLELTAAHGHAPALMDLLAHGNWQVVLLAAAAGAIVTMFMRGAARAVEWAIRRRSDRRLRRRAGVVVRRRTVMLARLPVLARHLAGRAPPSFA